MTYPEYNGEKLSWSLGLYFTHAEEEAGFPRMRAVIRAMLHERPVQLERERQDALIASSNRMFGHNAAKQLRVIEDELKIPPR